MDKITKEFELKVLESRPDGGRIRINTASLDRDKDRIFPTGAKIENYLKNPVVNWGHNYRDPWAIIGKTNELTITPEFIEADFSLRPPANDTDPQAVVSLLWRGNWVRTASIGFIPNHDRMKPNEFGGQDIEEWELVEWSIVAVPSNQDALRQNMIKILEASNNPIQEKVGRVLSAANEGKIRKSAELLAEVLAQLDKEEPKDFGTSNIPGGWEEDNPNWKPYPNEHACRIREPGDFEPDSFRRVQRNHEGKEYSVIMGKLKGETTMTEQAYRYPKDTWPVADARKHCKSHNGISFEPASEPKSASTGENEPEASNTNSSNSDAMAKGEIPDPVLDEVSKFLNSVLEVLK